MLRAEAESYRRVLEQKETELEVHLRNRDQIAAEKEPDVMDDLRLAAERDFAIQNLERDAALLQEVRAALDRIEDDEYGICLQCGQPISPKRLAALPWASRCIRCQETSDAHRKPRHSRPFDGMTDAA